MAEDLQRLTCYGVIEVMTDLPESRITNKSRAWRYKMEKAYLNDLLHIYRFMFDLCMARCLYSRLLKTVSCVGVCSCTLYSYYIVA